MKALVMRFHFSRWLAKLGNKQPARQGMVAVNVLDNKAHGARDNGPYLISLERANRLRPIMESAFSLWDGLARFNVNNADRCIRIAL